MHNQQILQIPEVRFKPIEQINLPPSILNDNVFPMPSARYYYVNSKGDKIAAPNTIGNPEERFLSLQIWYAMKSNNVFPLLTVYAKSRNDQIGINENDRPYVLTK